MGQLELFRAEVAQGRMDPCSIVVNLDVLKHMRLGCFARVEALAVDRFDLEAVVPTLHRGVVVAVALAAHAGDQAAVAVQYGLDGFGRAWPRTADGRLRKAGAMGVLGSLGITMRARVISAALFMPVTQGTVTEPVTGTDFALQHAGAW